MCGIAGIARREPSGVEPRTLLRMAAAIEHRGPDGEGFHFEPGVGLGHRRLSIIDLEGGKQPLYNEDETVVVKNHPNSFLKTDLKGILDADGIEDVVVVGAMSHMCIDATVRAASDYGYKTTVVQDACATRDLEFGGTTVPAASVHAAMMSALGFAYATITDTDAFTAQ